MMYKQPIYICAICGKQYGKIEDRIACETACFEHYKQEEDKRKKEELKAREYKEIERAYQTYVNLVCKYTDKYNETPTHKVKRDLSIEEQRLIQEIMSDTL